MAGFLSFSLVCPSVYAQEKPRLIRVGFFSAAEYHQRDDAGNRNGYGYEYLHELLKYCNWTYEYKEGTWDECLEMLEQGEIDLLTFAHGLLPKTTLSGVSSLDMGTYHARLYASNNFFPSLKKGESTLSIGLLEGDYRPETLVFYAEEKGFSYVPRPYATEEALVAALENGDIDALFTSRPMTVPRSRVIARFAPASFYSLVRMGDSLLLRELNAALAAIEQSNPNFERQLAEKYFDASPESHLALTAEEQAYLAQTPTLRVAVLPETHPLSWFEDARHQGALAGVLAKIQEGLGVQLEVLPTRSYQESLELLKADEADLIIPFAQDFNWAEQNGVHVTSSFLSLNYSVVMRQSQKPGQLSTIAVTRGSHYALQLAQKWADRYVEYPSEEDALKAVVAGQVDAALVNTYLAEYFLRHSGNDLKATLVSSGGNRLGVGVRADLGHPLYPIMEKAVVQLDPELVTDLVYQHAMFQDQPMSLSDFIYHFPMLSLSFTSIFLGLVIATLVLFLILNRRHAAKLNWLAYHDDRTGLWNLNGFEQQARELVEREKHKNFAVISMDVDGFDLIIEQYNRTVGYELVARISDVLKALCGPGTLAARGKSDHFFILIPWAEPHEIDHFLTLLSAQDIRYEEGGLSIHARFSYGVSLLEIGEREVTTSIDCAEIARHEAQTSISHLVYFDHALERRLQRERVIQDTMRRALEADQFEVYYQPRVNIRTGQAVGAEALVRWNSPELGFLSPSDFIQQFEHNGFIHDLDLYVLEKVCQTVCGWLKKGIRPIPISVNQSRVHFEDDQYLDRIVDILGRHNPPRELIELEITESWSINSPTTRETLTEIKTLGLGILVDDFGSEYSSLNWLGSIPADTLKIDRSFLLESNRLDGPRIILRKVVEMARDLHMSVICEGVETIEQAQFLLSIGCDLAQGFYYARPMPLREFEKIWLKKDGFRGDASSGEPA